jgi:cytochrome bd-type quinol oxidase subunit 2
MKEKIINNFQKALVALYAAITIVIFSSAPPVSATVDCTGLTGTEATKCQVCKSSSVGSATAVYTGGQCVDGAGAETDVTTLVEDVVNIFSWVVGIASVIMIMVGGFKYITSQGDSGNVSSAKNTILYAIIGLVVVAFAQIIVQFVINKV